jgi:PleD family two-component response regulator
LLGGDIGCSSIVAEGTNFWFTIPCGRPSPDSKVTFPPKEKTLSKTMGIVIHSKELEDEQEEEPSGDQAKVQIDGTVILLVEDNWAHQLVMEKRLQKMGCEVINAVNGRDALNILKKGEAMIDIVFMDIQMPLLVGICSPLNVPPWLIIS